MVASASRLTLTPTVTATPFHDGAVFWGSQVSGSRPGICISAVYHVFRSYRWGCGAFEADEFKSFARAAKLRICMPAQEQVYEINKAYT